MLDELLTAINQADLPASTRANAFALAACAHPDNGFVCLEWTEVAELFRLASVRSARRHLTAMKDAGLIHYSTNARVYVTFESFIARGRAENARGNTEIARGRAENDPALTRDLKAGKDLTTSKKEGDPTYLLPSEGSGEPQPPTATTTAIQPPPLTDQERSLALLTDPAVGVSGKLLDLARVHPFAQIRLQVFQALRQMAAPGSKVTSIGVIAHRLKVNAAATVTDEDRASDLWQRHETDADRLEERRRKYGLGTDTEAALRRKYIPDEYADIIIG